MSGLDIERVRIANAVELLASNKASFISGVDLSLMAAYLRLSSTAPPELGGHAGILLCRI